MFVVRACCCVSCHVGGGSHRIRPRNGQLGPVRVAASREHCPQDKEEEKPSTSNKARLLYEKLKQLKKEREETEGIAALLKLNKGRIT